MAFYETRSTGSRAGSGSANYSKQLIDRFEKENYANQSEKGLLVMADGTTKSFGGVEHHVTGEADDLKLMDGATFTHNHPTDVTFSTDDIANGIVKGNLKELRAVTSTGVIHILTNNGATIEQRRKFNTDFQQAKIKARNVAHKRQRRGESVDVEKYVSERAELFMAENAEKYGLKYQKKQR